MAVHVEVRGRHSSQRPVTEQDYLLLFHAGDGGGAADGVSVLDLVVVVDSDEGVGFDVAVEDVDEMEPAGGVPFGEKNENWSW